MLGKLEHKTNVDNYKSNSSHHSTWAHFENTQTHSHEHGGIAKFWCPT